MSTFSRRLACIAILLAATPSAFATWTGSLLIEQIKVQENGAVVSPSGFSITDASIPCGSSEFWLAPGADSNYKERLAVILAAKLSNAAVRISYYSCNSNGILNLGSVILR